MPAGLRVHAELTIVDGLQYIGPTICGTVHQGQLPGPLMELVYRVW